jgi:hypothetical protein
MQAVPAWCAVTHRARRSANRSIGEGWPAVRSFSEGRRRGWDSNPRDPFGSNGFQDRRLQPLGHPSYTNDQLHEAL